jgi:uncharacterized protein (TIGR03000 family)
MCSALGQAQPVAEPVVRPWPEPINQPNGQPVARVGTFYATPPGLRGFIATSPYYTALTRANFNGYPTRYYSYDVSPLLPTYLTSINYPTIYGAYGYQYAPGRFDYGLGRSAPSLQPDIYSVVVPSTLTAARTLPESAATAAATSAAIEVRLPANAQLVFDGQAMTQGGSLRRFVTPALEQGMRYTYELRTTWPQGGGEVSRTRQIEFRAGDRVVVDFTTQPTVPGTSTLRTRVLP